MISRNRKAKFLAAWLLAVAQFALACAGCGAKEPPRLTVFPVSGKLTVNGRPAEKAEVTLRPLADLNEPTKRSVLPFGRVEADGGFKIGTYQADDGAPAGEYAVTAVWPQIKIEGGEETFGPDRLKGLHGDTPHAITKITVKEGDNQIPPIKLEIH